ncbi:unnamed protein product [Orchesella dallaii]|uniref:Uncharacterized protein n=1 Tax=Orchesella dallaii TaxID=48710 RepID=A0ABP1RQ34_9HEXA
MGVGEAFINVQLVYQRYFDMPWYYSRSESMLILNPKLKTRWKMPFWHIVHLAVVICTLFSIFRINLMLREYMVTGMVNPEEMCFCGLVGAMSIQAGVTVYAFEVDPKRLAYSVTQTLNFESVVYKGWPSSNRIPDIRELVSYGMAIAFCNFPLIAGLYPLVFNLDPINTVFEGFIPELPRRLLAMITYITTTLLSATMCASFLLMCLTVVYIFDVQTTRNLKLSIGHPTEENMKRVDRLVENVMKAVLSFLEKAFRRDRLQIQPSTSKSLHVEAIDIEDPPGITETQPCGSERDTYMNFRNIYKNHVTTNLLMDMSNKNVEIHVPTMVSVGMAFCIILNYSVITLYTRKDMQVLIVAMVFILVAINGLILFLCYHASLPLIHTTETITYWKGCLTGKLALHNLSQVLTKVLKIKNMLADDNLVKYIRIQLRIQAIQGTIPFHFGCAEKLGAISSTFSLKWQVVKTGIIAFYDLVLWLQLFHEAGSNSLLVSVESLMFAIANLLFLTTKWMFILRRKQFVELFTPFLRFEKNQLIGANIPNIPKQWDTFLVKWILFEILNFFKRNLKSIKSEVDSCFNQVIGHELDLLNRNSSEPYRHSVEESDSTKISAKESQPNDITSELFAKHDFAIQPSPLSERNASEQMKTKEELSASSERNSDANMNSRIKINADSETNANDEINASASANGKGYFGADENVVEAKMSSSEKRNTVGNADSRSSYEKLEEARRAYFSHSEVNKKYVDEMTSLGMSYGFDKDSMDFLNS